MNRIQVYERQHSLLIGGMQGKASGDAFRSRCNGYNESAATKKQLRTQRKGNYHTLRGDVNWNGQYKNKNTGWKFLKNVRREQLEQCFSDRLRLQPFPLFTMAPHAVLTLNHGIIAVATS